MGGEHSFNPPQAWVKLHQWPPSPSPWCWRAPQSIPGCPACDNVDINLGNKSWRNLGKSWEHDNFGNSMAKHLEGCGNMWGNVGNIGKNSGTIMGKMGTWQRNALN